MSTTLARSAGRTTDLVAPVSCVGHLAVGGLGVVVARQDPGDPTSRAFWLLAAFCALGLVATLLAWASVRLGGAAWNAGVAVLLVALGVLAAALAGDHGLGLLGIAIAFLFVDWVVFGTARRAVSRPGT